MGDDLEPVGRDWDRHELLWSMHGGVGWGGWLVIVILLLLLAALVIAVVIALIRSLPGLGTAATGPRQTEAELLLDERYARGEIDEIEYLHRRAVLRGG
jgi:putative membrane protein